MKKEDEIAALAKEEYKATQYFNALASQNTKTGEEGEKQFVEFALAKAKLSVAKQNLATAIYGDK